MNDWSDPANITPIANILDLKARAKAKYGDDYGRVYFGEHVPLEVRVAVNAGRTRSTPKGLDVLDEAGRVVSRWRLWMEPLPGGGFRPHCDRVPRR